MLNDEVVYLLMSNRKDSPFRVELIRRMIGFKFDSKAKLLNLIAMLNNKVSERGLASIYHKKKSIFDTVYVDPLTKWLQYILSNYFIILIKCDWSEIGLFGAFTKYEYFNAG